MEENKTDKTEPQPNTATTEKTEDKIPFVQENQPVQENAGSAPESKRADSIEVDKQEKAIDPLKNIDRLMDVEMNVTVRFGKTEIPLREAINFGIGSMIELNRSVDEPVDILVNSHLFARGEVVVLDGYYGVRVTEIGSPEERSHTLLKNANN